MGISQQIEGLGRCWYPKISQIAPNFGYVDHNSGKSTDIINDDRPVKKILISIIVKSPPSNDISF